jgi:hypothetical protein
MTTFRPKLWTAVGAAALLSACSPGGQGPDKVAADTAPPRVWGVGVGG